MHMEHKQSEEISSEDSYDFNKYAFGDDFTVTNKDISYCLD